MTGLRLCARPRRYLRCRSVRIGARPAVRVPLAGMDEEPGRGVRVFMAPLYRPQRGWNFTDGQAFEKQWAVARGALRGSVRAAGPGSGMALTRGFQARAVDLKEK